MREYDHYTRSAAMERRGWIDGSDEGREGGRGRRRLRGAEGDGEGVEDEFDRSS